MIEKIKSAVWAEGQKNQMNRAFAFVLDLGKKQMGEICLSAASCYKVIADGKLMGFGPNRTAHGYARAAVYPFNAQYITTGRFGTSLKFTSILRNTAMTKRLKNRAPTSKAF